MIQKLKQNVHDQKVDVSEPVFGYALDYLGYKVNNTHFAQATEEGTDYSAKDINGVQDDIKEKENRLFREQQPSQLENRRRSRQIS